MIHLWKEGLLSSIVVLAAWSMALADNNCNPAQPAADTTTTSNTTTTNQTVAQPNIGYQPFFIDDTHVKLGGNQNIPTDTQTTDPDPKIEFQGKQDAAQPPPKPRPPPPPPGPRADSVTNDPNDIFGGDVIVEVYPDGTEVRTYPSGKGDLSGIKKPKRTKVESKRPDGRKITRYPGGAISEEVSDGTITYWPNGDVSKTSGQAADPRQTDWKSDGSVTWTDSEGNTHHTPPPQNPPAGGQQN